MKRFILFVVCLLCFKSNFKAQSDSVICDGSFKITEGIYVSYEDFRRNDPLRRDQIENNLNKDQLDYFGKTLNAEKISVVYHNNKMVIESGKVWGYYQNNALHINYNKKFYRVPVFGSINYLVALVEVINPTYYPSYGGGIGMTGSVKTQELREFIFNFYDGILTPFSMDLAEHLISRDTTVFAEYKTLKRKKQKEQVSRFIRKYNELHPVYFLK